MCCNRAKGVQNQYEFEDKMQKYFCIILKMYIVRYCHIDFVHR